MKWVRDKTGRFPQRPHYLPQGDRRRMRAHDPCLPEQEIRKGRDSQSRPTISRSSSRRKRISIPTPIFPASPARLRASRNLPPASGPSLEFPRAQRTQHGKPAAHNAHARIRPRSLSPVHVRRPSEPAAISCSRSRRQAHTNKCHRDNMIGASERDWMEWQAGYACGAILMPAVGAP